MPNETYLGDGVYASFDGYQIKPYTDAHGNVIYLDPEVYSALKEFVERLSRRTERA